MDRVRQKPRVFLIEGPGEQQVAATDLGQQLPPLFFSSFPGDGQGRHRGGMKRHRGDGSTNLLQNEAQVGKGQPLPAVLFRQGYTKPAQVGHLPPQLRGIAQVVLFHFPGQAGRAFGLQELPGQVLYHLFFFARQYVHKLP